MTANFTLTSSSLDDVKSAEDLRALMSENILEMTSGAADVLCANTDGVIAESCDDPALDATTETLRAVESAVAVKSRTKSRTLVVRSLSALYADRLELRPLVVGVS